VDGCWQSDLQTTASASADTPSTGGISVVLEFYPLFSKEFEQEFLG
jgi:hypothetical protein